MENLREHYALTLRHWVNRLEARRAEAINVTSIELIHVQSQIVKDKGPLKDVDPYLFVAHDGFQGAGKKRMSKEGSKARTGCTYSKKPQ